MLVFAIPAPLRGGLYGLVLALPLFLSACESTGPGPETRKEYDRPLPDGVAGLERVQDLSTLPSLREAFEHRTQILAALEQSLIFFAKPSSKNWFPHRVSDRDITHEDMVATLEAFKEILETSTDGQDFQGRLLNQMDFYRSVGWDAQSGEVFFTAYVTPIFDGRRTPDADFRYPLYKLPPDLLKAADGTPLGRKGPNGETLASYTREEIERDGIYRGMELVWLDDPWKVYIVHVQGSAKIRLPSGEETMVGYAGKTEHTYVSIRQKLIEEGKIDGATASLQSIEDYFAANPDDVERVLALNPCYVFFTEYGSGGPYGSIGSIVTGWHTIATDKTVFPRGGPAITAVRLPVARGSGERTFEHDRTARIVFDQDTGGAIRSAGRTDIYYGIGDEAKTLAGETKSEGRLFYFFIKPR